MIAKHVPMRDGGKSSFAGLVAYVTNSQGKDHRVGEVRLTNCESGCLDAAVEEVLATQHLNKRAKGDKTFHLLLSFRSGERPDAKVLAEVEDRVCSGLGYGEHQRVSVVHHDTDNLHIHVAINKIHPKRKTMHEPWYFQRTLAELCAAMERDYGLQVDNHMPHQRGAAGRAFDMERHAGVESLTGWIKRECLTDLRGADTWGQLHQVMRKHGLMVRARGAGLVIQARDGTTVRASTVSRDLSKASLEKRLGVFEEAEERKGGAGRSAVREYLKQPMPSKMDTTALYARYRQDQGDRQALRSSSLAEARCRKNKAVEAAKHANRRRRLLIKYMSRGVGKQLLYSHARRVMKAQLEQIHADYARDRKKIFQDGRRLTWADWLREKALEGDESALQALRSRTDRREAAWQDGVIAGAGRLDREPIQSTVDGITKLGTVIFRAGKATVRDDGSRLQVIGDASRKTLHIALQLTAQRYGSQITVNGTAEFKAQILLAAVEYGLPITFADQGMEQRRQEMLVRRKAQEGKNGAEHDRRRADRRSVGDVGARATRGRGGREAGHSGFGTRSDRSRRRGVVSDAGRAGSVPPTTGPNRLRTLSEVDVVRLASGNEVLLPRDVSDHVEQQGTKPDHALRRPLHGMKIDPLAAAERYIAERDEKRARGINVPKHILYNGQKLEATFQGVRNIDGQALALLNHGEQIMVKPVDRATAQRLSKVSIGKSVSVTQTGSIKTMKGRSR